MVNDNGAAAGLSSGRGKQVAGMCAVVRVRSTPSRRMLGDPA
jgi:hypothetical protein